jgi:hypothetical protein
MARLNQVAANGMRINNEFDSLEDFANTAAKYVRERYPSGMRTVLDDKHYYGDTGTVGAAFVMAREGWAAHLDDTLQIAESAVETVEREHEEMAFSPVWQVSGGMVDMGAYLANEPECMVEFPPAKTTKTGRVVTICASISLSGAVSAERLVLKGKVVTALALELERLGMSTELIADQTVTGYDRDKHGNFPVFNQRITLKGANDALDPARILFGYAHPATLRVLALCNYHALPDDGNWPNGTRSWQSAIIGGGGYGTPTPPPRDLPEGTLYLPETLSGTDTDAAELLTGYLRELGVI